MKQSDHTQTARIQKACQEPSQMVWKRSALVISNVTLHAMVGQYAENLPPFLIELIQRRGFHHELA
jgi:hypothetical protein